MVYMIKFLCAETDEQLKAVLEFCYGILGQYLREVENYRYEDWQKRIEKYSPLLLYAVDADDEKSGAASKSAVAAASEAAVIAAVLGRPENSDSLVMGFAACDEKYRRQGITSELIRKFELNAAEMKFKYITLGADKDAEGFYEKCGYNNIFEVHGQKIYQKIL